MDSKKNSDNKAKEETPKSIEQGQSPSAPTYVFGGIKEFNLEQIETEILNDNIYIDVFAGSDIQLKTEVKPTAPALAAIRRLDTITYKWNDKVPANADSSTQLGVSAQQVAAEFPELVKKDAATGFLAVNYTKLSVHLISAIKELADQNEALEARIRALEKTSALN